MSETYFAGLHLARYELCLQAKQETILPRFLGSTLRGAFGHALKEAVCIMPHRNCERCLVADRCIFPYLFDTPPPPNIEQLRGQQKAPHPFILTPPFLENPCQRTWKMPSPQHNGNQEHKPQAKVTFSPTDRRAFRPGDEIKFGLLLLGRAIDYLPYVIHAFSEMARRGLGADRARFELKEVFGIDEHDRKTTIYLSKTKRLEAGATVSQSLSDLVQIRLTERNYYFAEKDGRDEAARERVKLRFLTPTRIRVKDDLQTEISFELLMRNLFRRLSTLMAVHFGTELNLHYGEWLAEAATIKTKYANLKWDDWERFSNRQKTKMNLGGFIGEMKYEGAAIEEFLPFLLAGEFLHLGTGTTFGLGKYEVV